ncbi:MAG: hypothetical protein PUC32_02320 [Oscillospiraceae bacterium]|nr:hypothetical protein [Oscillospiraceae bacterium]
MKAKTIFLTVVLAVLAPMCLLSGGCGRETTAAMSPQGSSLPFTMPALFTYDKEASAKNGMLTFTSDSGTTLIVAYSDTQKGFLQQSRSHPLTENSLVTSYKDAGLDVSVTDLKLQDSDTALTYTFTVHLSTQNGSTITRKYIRITEGKVLDLSCGGNVVDSDTIDLDYGAVVQAIEQGT